MTGRNSLRSLVGPVKSGVSCQATRTEATDGGTCGDRPGWLGQARTERNVRTPGDPLRRPRVCADRDRTGRRRNHKPPSAAAGVGAAHSSDDAMETSRSQGAVLQSCFQKERNGRLNASSITADVEKPDGFVPEPGMPLKVSLLRWKLGRKAKSTSAGASRLHPESQRQAPSAGHPLPRRPGRSGSGAAGDRTDLRGRLPGLLARVPAGPEPCPRHPADTSQPGRRTPCHL